MDVANHCCYTWSLGTGTIIIGVLNVIGSILQIAVVANNWDLYQYANDDISGENSDTKRELVTVLVFGIIQAICSVLLITGAVKEKASMLLPWMVVETLALVVATVIGIILGIFLIELRIGSVIIVFVIFFLCLRLYFLRVVLIYYRTLRENTRTNMVSESAPLLT
ncbi:uncharacterized protein LOC126106470 [Schistocerca cancellata]|uniref:uncharacterized protein LOC126106470 n=1 Tax=Schistocerca cancellata TaxID=274614 RepID=UPI002117A1A8|nr:uncharacterized protein LOC126106470 [Schistocerca cancellata]